MIKLLKRSQITKIAKKLKWKDSDTKKAIEEFLSYPSVLDSEKFLMVCAESKSSFEREKNIKRFVSDQIIDDLSYYIPELLYIDVCFLIVEVFYMKDIFDDLKKNKKENLFIPHTKKKTFFKWLESAEVTITGTRAAEIEMPPVEIRGLEYPMELTYDCIDHVINDSIREKIDRKEYENISRFLDELFTEVFNRVGLLALNIKSFRKLLIT